MSLQSRSLFQDFSTPPLQFTSNVIEPSHLKISHFGPTSHSTTQIHCVLPLTGNRILLVGHDEGLSVFNMFPQESTDNEDLAMRGPADGYVLPIWRGETVYQMSLIEFKEFEGNGVVLALVGSSNKSTRDAIRTVRLYNLGSLISLARWTISLKGSKPVDLHQVASPKALPLSSKRHSPHESIARDVLDLDNLPFRWATDFVPLAPVGSHLAKSSVSCFATWLDENKKGKRKGTELGSQLLAVATKTAILLYETPKGERVFRFIKASRHVISCEGPEHPFQKFYTPLQACNLAFVRQDPGIITKENVGDESPIPLHISTHLSLFVVFDRHQGLIHLADATTEKVKLADDGAPSSLPVITLEGPESSFGARDSNSGELSSAPNLHQRARLLLGIRETSSRWLLPTRCELQAIGSSPEQGSTQSVLVLTKDKRTHVVPSPLPPRVATQTPLHIVSWKHQPKHVSARIILKDGDQFNESPILQLVSFNENGIEVYETICRPIWEAFIAGEGRGKTEAPPEKFVRAEVNLGETGFLAHGGNWDRMGQVLGLHAELAALESAGNGHSKPPMSAASYESMVTGIFAHLQREEGMYGWYRKAEEDWRIFWVGGSQAELKADSRRSI